MVRGRFSYFFLLLLLVPLLLLFATRSARCFLFCLLFFLTRTFYTSFDLAFRLTLMRWKRGIGALVRLPRVFQVSRPRSARDTRSNFFFSSSFYFFHFFTNETKNREKKFRPIRNTSRWSSQIRHCLVRERGKMESAKSAGTRRL